MKTIKDSVIALNGKLPDENEQGCFRALYAAIYYVEGDNGIRLGSFEEFESCARRLGYINGYRWGVEYPTNGKRPDLPDTLFVKYQHKTGGEWLNNPFPVYSWAWEETSEAFKIVDEAYKPADTSYLNVQPQEQGLTHSEEGLTHSEWWDYENDKRVATPPVGEKLLFDDSGVMTESIILYIGKEKMLATISDGSDIECCMGVASLDFYYPLDHTKRKADLEREKVIEAAVMVCTGVNIPTSTDGLTTKTLNKLYDNGMLVLPPKKSDTED